MTELEIHNESWQAPEEVPALGRKALVVGVIGALALAVGFLVDRDQFFRSYLVGYLYWLSIGVGCLAVSMIQHLSSGGWGLAVRRVLGAAHRTVPLMALLFVPILLGTGSLYEWTLPEALAENDLLAAKAPYLNVPFFAARAAIYFVIWGGLSLWLSRLSLQQDASGDPAIYRKVQRISGLGLGLYVLASTFAAFDWIMSLDPEWYSTIFGLWFITGHGLSAFAFIIVIALYLGTREPLRKALQKRHIHDYGKLMLAFVMLWAYMAYSQFLIIWSANIPEEITFYIDRFQGGWKLIALLLVVAHFALPFALLLSRDLKRNARRLVWIAGLVLVMRWFDLYWQVGPVFREGLGIHWLDVTAVLTIGGFWLFTFTRQLASRPLLAVGDPFLVEAIQDE